MSNNKFQVYSGIGFLSILWFVIFVILAIVTFEGGYDFWYYYLSDLGLLIAWNGNPNDPGHIYFTLAVCGVSICLIVFHLVTWPYYIQQNPDYKVEATIAEIFGVISGIFFFLVGLFPRGQNDPLINLHSVFANFYGFLNFGLMIPWYIIITREDKTKAQLIIGLLPGITYVLMIILYLVVPWFVPAFQIDNVLLYEETHWWRPTFQKFIIFSFIWWLATLCYWMYQKGFKWQLPPVGSGLHEYQVYTSHNTYQVSGALKDATPDQILESYMTLYHPRGFEFDLFENKGQYLVKHDIFQSKVYDFKTWLEALKKNIEAIGSSGPYHVYIEMKHIEDTRNFPVNFDSIIQSVFEDSSIHVFSQTDYQNNGNKFPEPTAMQNAIMFQISGSAGETTLLKPICDVLYHICQRLCPLFSAKKNYDDWQHNNKLAFPDITGYNFRRYTHRVFINFPKFMITNLTREEILQQEQQGKIVRTFIVDENFMKSSEGVIPNLLTVQIDPTKTPAGPLPGWVKK